VSAYGPSLSDQLQSFEEAPRPLTDEERRLVKRIFSDYFEVPAEWKRELRADLERDPPILGKQTLGGVGDAKIPPSSLDSGGNFGNSTVGYLTNALTFNYPTGPSIRNDPVYGTRLDFWTNEIRLGAAFQDIAIRRSSPNAIDLMVDTLRFGSNAGVSFTRDNDEQIGTGQRLQLSKPVGPNETPLVVNVGGVLKNVLVGTNGGLGGSGIRLLYVVA
jgi:hypothetical protein